MTSLNPPGIRLRMPGKPPVLSGRDHSLLPAVRFGEKRPRDMPSLREKNGWEKHPWYKTLWKHRFKWAMLPLLATPLKPLEALGFRPDQSSPTTSVSSLNTEKHPGAPSVQPRAGVAGSMDRSKVANFSAMVFTALLFKLMLRQVQNRYSRRLLAQHELGHMLVFLGLRDFPHALKEVKIRTDRESFTLGELGYNRFAPLQDKPENARTPEERLRVMKQWMLTHKGGAVMEDLIAGYHRNGNEIDRIATFGQGMEAFWQTVDLDPAHLPQFLHFAATLGPRIEKYLTQFDRKTIDALTEKLARDGTWDEDTLRRLIDEYKLDRYTLEA